MKEITLLDDDIKKTSPKLVYIDSNYLSYLHNEDSRVSLKKDRPYVGLAVIINGNNYVVPLTSQTTQKRKQNGLKKRNSLTTIFIKAAKVEISALLVNNMIPVPEHLTTPIKINPQKDTYLMNEHRFIRKHWVEINRKVMSVYIEHKNENSKNYKFLQSICCDFERLEILCREYK